jgi:hypothetical protein
MIKISTKHLVFSFCFAVTCTVVSLLVLDSPADSSPFDYFRIISWFDIICVLTVARRVSDIDPGFVCALFVVFVFVQWFAVSLVGCQLVHRCRKYKSLLMESSMNLIRKVAILFKRTEFLSAPFLLQRAGLIAVLFLVAHLAGLREYTSILNGTMGSVTLGWKLSAFFGVSYVVLYLAFVVLVPILVLAAGMLMVWEGFKRKMISG